MHRNITFGRLVLDFYQFIRAQKPVMKLLGPQFTRDRHLVEIDITYRCNIICYNCNRSCTQAPSGTVMPATKIESFLQQSISRRISWRRIRLLGGEPTLHPQLAKILQLLLDYKSLHNPGLRIVLCTNGAGKTVKSRLQGIPAGVVVKSTEKSRRQRLFRPFNMAPVDNPFFRFADFRAGCRVIRDCGLGFTPSGYYPCAIAGGIDRIMGFNAGRSRLPSATDEMRDLMELFCRYCGHFGFLWPTRKQKMSPSWQHAYRRYNLAR